MQHLLWSLANPFSKGKLVYIMLTKLGHDGPQNLSRMKWFCYAYQRASTVSPGPVFVCFLSKVMPYLSRSPLFRVPACCPVPDTEVAGTAKQYTEVEPHWLSHPQANSFWPDLEASTTQLLLPLLLLLSLLPLTCTFTFYPVASGVDAVIHCPDTPVRCAYLPVPGAFTSDLRSSLGTEVGQWSCFLQGYTPSGGERTAGCRATKSPFKTCPCGIILCWELWWPWARKQLHYSLIAVGAHPI